MRNVDMSANDLQTSCSTLFVFSPTPQDRTFQLQMDLLSERRDALRGHEVVVAEVFENQHGQIGDENLPAEGCNGLRRHYHIPSGRFSVMLVGKDDHIKMVADSCVSFEEVVMRVENEPVHPGI